MLARFVLLVPALLSLALSTATDAEARRLRLFSFAKAATPAKPGAAAPLARSASPAAARTSRSGAFIFVSGGRGGPAGAAPAANAPAEEPRPRYEPKHSARPSASKLSLPLAPASRSSPFGTERPDALLRSGAAVSNLGACCSQAWARQALIA